MITMKNYLSGNEHDFGANFFQTKLIQTDFRLEIREKFKKKFCLEKSSLHSRGGPLRKKVHWLVQNKREFDRNIEKNFF